MNEEQEKVSVNKENTIDIFVSPKKREGSSAETVPEKKEKAKPSPRQKKPSDSGADRTRAVSVPSSRKTVETQAEKTRVGGVLSVKNEKKSPSDFAEPKKPRLPKAVKEKKIFTPAEKKAARASMQSTLILALIYIAVVVGISSLLSFFGIRWANDVFALVKEEVVATVTIPENATIAEVASILDDCGLIEYPSIFRMYIGFKNRDADPPLQFKAGEYELKSTLNYDQIVSKIKNRRSRSIVTITIPEGYSVDDIINLFTSQGIGSREGFVDAINNFPYNYTFMEKLNAIELSPNRRYRLEGYLFPDTYEFYTDSKEIAIVDKMLAAFEAHFEKEYYIRLDELGMNLDEVITLASIVQREGKFNSDFYPIAGVFHNRLNSRDLKKLESDATVQYCLEEHKEDLTYADLEVDNPYNTHVYSGLPPSAIANPGWEAIQAALYPESNKYYYFVSDTDGSMLFASTHAQHLNNAAAVARAKENGTSVN
ncbi:MAG: endolytic transglycosylase MltG [Clostridia bacterium]|nr:endolytic transglycosylase MltG [Clostridia bacterium]